MISRPRRLAAALVVGLVAAPLAAQAQLRPMVIPTKTGDIVVSRDSAADFWRIKQARGPQGVHALATFLAHPTVDQRRQLAAAGTRVLSVFSGLTYWVFLTPAATREAQLFEPLIFTAMPAQHRVEPAIWAGQYARFVVRPKPDSAPVNYVLNRDSTVNLTVTMHDDVPPASVPGLLGRFSRRVTKLSDRDWVVVVARSQVRELATLDQIRWIDAAPPPPLPDNDATRALINVDAVQGFNAGSNTFGGLSGNNVQVGIFDSGIDETHDDFGSRIIRVTTDVSAHGTHVAGTVAGNGRLSNGNDSWGQANGGTLFQWRGMAPRAELIEANNGSDRFNAAVWLSFVQSNSLDLSNHSYSFSFDGDYNSNNAFIDRLVRGDATSGGVAIAARLPVFSAGNHGDWPRNGGNQVGFYALTKQVKNGLVVGNIDGANNRIAGTSSLGPTYDGRIKPDVVAPGQAIKSTGWCNQSSEDPGTCTNGTTTTRRDYYRPKDGTSMAAPAVTGTLALMLEQYRVTYRATTDAQNPWPSTLRAAVIHTAVDLAGTAAWFTNADGPVFAQTGPDFVTGYGRIDAQAGVRLIANRLLIQGTIQATCDTDSYIVDVAAGAPELRVTLAWDDFEGNPSLSRFASKLVNDLDVELIAPDGTRHYPWLLNQQAVDASGNPVADASQVCGSTLTINRPILPTASPNFVNVGSAANVNDPIPTAGFPAAGRGRDHLNNVEQVLVANPMAGRWRVHVIGFNAPQAPQRYSLVGVRPATIVPPNICRFKSLLCDAFIPRNICERYPDLCPPRIIFPERGIIPVIFRDTLDRVVVPVNRICLYAIDCPGCELTALCGGFDLSFASMPASFGIEIFDSDGRRVFSDRSARVSKRVSFRAVEGRDYYMVISPGTGTELNKAYDLSLPPRRRP